MRLGRLSGLERDKLQAEADDLTEKIAYYKRILSEPTLRDEIIKEELLETKIAMLMNGEPIDPTAGI